MNDEYYMFLALKEAKKAMKKGDVPIGAIIVKENKIISKGYNSKEKNKTAINHAEIIAINKACHKLKSWRLEGCSIYVTMEPCLMCAGAILQSRMSELIYAVPNKKFGYIESIESLLNNKKNNHKVIVRKNILQEKALNLIQNFFKEKRRK